MPGEPFDVIAISLGVNDVTRGVDLTTWLSQQEQLLALLTSKFGAKTIFVSGMPPM